nr:MAG TPA: hypothetical protein [Caudoviricetes sp.]
MTELKTAAQIREMMADKQRAIRSSIDLIEIYDKINNSFNEMPLGKTHLKILARSLRKYINIPDKEWTDSIPFILDELKIMLKDNGFIVRNMYGLSFSEKPPRVGLLIYWDKEDLPDQD